MQVVRAFFIGLLGTLPLGLFLHGLKNVIRGNATVATITWTVVGAVGMVGLLFWYRKEKQEVKTEIQRKDE